ncbi:MAG TPA: hypothetical protein VFJ06_14865 [Halococcus sp.]|nr:hypothetical protein [Halococcus sp.]
MTDLFSNHSVLDSWHTLSTVTFRCPDCHEPPNAIERWIRVGGAASEALSESQTQRLLDDELDSSEEESITGERMITLQPCEHSFRHDDLAAVMNHLRVLDELITRHDAATTDFERHECREEIRRIGAKLDAALERCETRVDEMN